jgi:hypothetical protein
MSVELSTSSPHDLAALERGCWGRGVFWLRRVYWVGDCRVLVFGSSNRRGVFVTVRRRKFG